MQRESINTLLERFQSLVEVLPPTFQAKIQKKYIARIKKVQMKRDNIKGDDTSDFFKILPNELFECLLLVCENENFDFYVLTFLSSMCSAKVKYEEEKFIFYMFIFIICNRHIAFRNHRFENLSLFPKGCDVRANSPFIDCIYRGYDIDGLIDKENMKEHYRSHYYRMMKFYLSGHVHDLLHSKQGLMSEVARYRYEFREIVNDCFSGWADAMAYSKASDYLVMLKVERILRPMEFENLNSAVDSFSNKEICGTSNINTLFLYTIWKIKGSVAKSGYIVRQCRCCPRYFLAGKFGKSEEHCGSASCRALLSYSNMSKDKKEEKQWKAYKRQNKDVKTKLKTLAQFKRAKRCKPPGTDHFILNI